MRNILIALMILGTLSAQAGPLEERMAPCFACHGEKGQSENTEVPSLGGQTAPFVLIQLYLFREKQRNFEIMNEIAKTLTDDDLQTISDAVAKLPPPKPDTAGADAAKIAKGVALIQQYRCNFCHNADLSGRDNVPRIAGQREDFLIKTMREYKSNTRHGYDATMAEVLQPVSDDEMVQLAYFVSRQP